MNTLVRVYHQCLAVSELKYAVWTELDAVGFLNILTSVALVWKNRRIPDCCGASHDLLLLA